WSILAWQLAGKRGLEILNGAKGMAERDSAPAENVMMELLAIPNAEGVSSLILLDEVLMYARQKVAEDKAWITKLQAFFQALTQAAVKTDRCVIVASLLASELDRMDKLGLEITNALKDIFARQQEEPVEPVVKEDVAEVLRRRFFKPESIKDKEALRPHAITAFKGISAHDEATKRQGAEAEKRYVESYPFHPELTEVFYSNWVQLDQFQRTRGVLRLFAMALRDSAGKDPCPMVGANVFLKTLGQSGLSDAMRDLVDIADAQSADGQTVAWSGILNRELGFAREIQRDFPGLANREIEQAVLTTFFYSQPAGQKAHLRELKLAVAPTNPDRIELEKAFSRWAQESYWLDDKFTATEGGSLPEDWRLGNKPNLTQIHREKKRGVESDTGLIAVRLDKAIREVKKLTEGASAMGVRSHTLPEKPSDIEDDGKFHFAVLGTDAASESGKPSPVAKKFMDETTSAAKPRVYRNAVILAVPSKDGLEMLRSRIADLLAWEQVALELNDKKNSGNVDAQRLQRLTVELEKAKKLVPDAIRQAWCLIVTVSETNDVQAFKLGITDDPLFMTLKGDPRARLQETKITAESLLPDGPYDLWQEGDKLRRVKDLAGAFAQLPHLPKMLNVSAIVDTLVDGCVAGDFVLQLKRPDKTVRTWWRSRPDDEALKDTDLEVVLSAAAELGEIPGALLRKGTLASLWETKAELPLSEFKAYFAGDKVVQVDRGGYNEGQEVPKASAEVVNAAVEKAVADGDLWLVSGTTSLFKESIPAGVLTDASLLLPPPEPIMAAAILEANVPAAWKGGKATVAGVLAQLSAQRGKPVPWYQVQQAVDGAIRARLVELDAQSASWPCDASAAAKVVFKAVTGAAGGGGGGLTMNDKGVPYRALLQPNELQDLADSLSEIMELQVKHGIKIRFNLAVEATAEGDLKPEATAELRKLLDGISDAFH
ncbi:MAG: ATP-binding protein, partial [Verrucomicrobiales bacterium]|nr:ATP-binding protein [Verrucomicrobiales bacterium]